MKHKKRKAFVSVLLILAVAAIVGMYLYCCFFVFYAQDDVCFFLELKQSMDKFPSFNYLRNVAMKAFDYYFTWQGNYLENFVVFSLTGFYRMGIRSFQLVLAAIVCAFFMGLTFLQYEIAHSLNVKHTTCVTLLLVLLVMLTGMNNISPADFFFWISGAVAYALPVSLAFFGGGTM